MISLKKFVVSCFQLPSARTDDEFDNDLPLIERQPGWISVLCALLAKRRRPLPTFPKPACGRRLQAAQR